MGEEYTKKLQCTLCSSINLIEILKLPDTPIANQLFTNSQKSLNQKKYPLNLLMCRECLHVQIGIIVDPNILFENYPYTSSSSQIMSDRLDKLAEFYTKEFPNKQYVLEIGSNDGYLLQSLKKLGWQVLGVDPAKEISQIANEKGITTINDFFDSRVAEIISNEFGLPQLIIANNVLAHSDNLQDIFAGICQLMSEECVLVIEFSYLLDIYQDLIFDTIYHEHTSYHSVTSLQKFLVKYNLEIYKTERFNAHGGSLRTYIRLCNQTSLPENSVKDRITEEYAVGIHLETHWEKFQQSISALSERINNDIHEIKKERKIIAGYGLPAKFTTLFYGLKINPHNIDFIIDDNPLKIGAFAPGTKIPIIGIEQLTENQPHTIILFSWNYSDELIYNINVANLRPEFIIVPLPKYKKISFTRIG